MFIGNKMSNSRNLILASLAGALGIAGLSGYVSRLSITDGQNTEACHAIQVAFYGQHRIILSETGFRLGITKTEIPISLVDLYIGGQIHDPAQIANIFNVHSTNGNIALRLSARRDEQFLNSSSIGYVVESLEKAVVLPHHTDHPSKYPNSKVKPDEIYIRFKTSVDGSTLFPLEYLKLVAQSADKGLKQIPDYQGSYFFVDKDKTTEQEITDITRFLAVEHVRASRQIEVSASR